MKNWQNIFGLSLLGIAVFCWIAVPILPFLGWHWGLTTALVSGLFVAGEVCFAFSLIFLGKEFIARIKQIFKINFKSKKQIKNE
jgi:hypothetical protein